MKITVAETDTHVLITFEANNACEGYELGRAREVAIALGARLVSVTPMLQFQLPKVKEKHSASEGTNILVSPPRKD